MNRKEKFTFINELGQSIELSLFSPFFVESITGISGLNNIIYSSKGLSQDGSTFTGSTLSDRNIVIQGAITRNIEVNKNNLIKVFNPKLRAKLVYENETVKKYVDCKVENSPNPTGARKPRFQISLLCNNPYWKEYNQCKAQIALWKSNFHFPLVIPKDTGIIMGHREPSLIVNVHNGGHVETGMIIEFTAKGELKNPSLFNVNTREFIKVNRTMIAGETITVNTNYGKKSIIRSYNGKSTNVLNDIDIIGGGDTFLQLDIGDNLFRYDADSNLNNLEVSIKLSHSIWGYKMELYIFNSSLNFIGILDTFTSFRIVRKYYSNGEFELQCPLTKNTLSLLKRDNIIFKKGDCEANYIETVQLNISEDGQEVIIVNGKDLKGYFNRRINWGRTFFKGTCENLMRNLVVQNAITPTNTKRKIPHLILGDLKGFTQQINYQNSFGNLFKQLQFISAANHLGFRNLFDIKHKNIIFDVYKGVDRTVDNGKIAPCIFSRSFENILQQEYFDSVNNYKNTCLIAGAGESENRKLTSIEKGEGLNRYELYVDARDISDVRKINDEEKTINTTEYNGLLCQRGYEKLSAFREVKTLSGKINLHGNNKYKTDFDLGDIVAVKDKKWEVLKNVRITEIEEIYEESGLDINVTFGNPIPTLLDKIKQMKN